MSMFNPEKIPGLRLIKALRGYDGKIKKVYSESKRRWILLSMFPNNSQNIIRKKFAAEDEKT